MIFRNPFRTCAFGSFNRTIVKFSAETVCQGSMMPRLLQVTCEFCRCVAVHSQAAMSVSMSLEAMRNLFSIVCLRRCVAIEVDR